VSKELIPFSGIVDVLRMGRGRKNRRRLRGDAENNLPRGPGTAEEVDVLGGDEETGDEGLHRKHRPRVAGGGENVPLEVLRALSCWLAVMEEGGKVPGTTLGGMFGCIAALEDSLACM